MISYFLVCHFINSWFQVFCLWFCWKWLFWNQGTFSTRIMHVCVLLHLVACCSHKLQCLWWFLFRGREEVGVDACKPLHGACALGISVWLFFSYPKHPSPIHHLCAFCWITSLSIHQSVDIDVLYATKWVTMDICQPWCTLKEDKIKREGLWRKKGAWQNNTANITSLHFYDNLPVQLVITHTQPRLEAA